MDKVWNEGGYSTGKVLIQNLGGTKFRVFANDLFERRHRTWSACVQLTANGYSVAQSVERFSSRAKRDAYVKDAIASGAECPNFSMWNPDAAS